MISERAPGVPRTRLATCSDLVFALQRTTSKVPKLAANVMIGWREDAGREAGTIMASSRARRNLANGVRRCDTSLIQCACDCRCRRLVLYTAGDWTAYRWRDST